MSTSSKPPGDAELAQLRRLVAEAVQETQAQPAARTCWFGLHRWSHWRIDPRRSWVQRRTCLRCGYCKEVWI